MITKECLDTHKNVNNFVKLVDGVTPSDIGLTFREAAIFLLAFVVAIRMSSKCNTDWPRSEFRSTLLEYLEEARNLADFFIEAAYLTE